MTLGEQGGVGAPPQECRRILDAGGNVVDTAINYRGGASEEILGELLDKLGSLEVELPAGAVQCLESAAEFDVGFPTSFIREASGWVFGAARPG